MNAQQLFEMGQKQQTQAAAQNTQPQQKIQPAADGDSWTCSCGAVSTGKFCPECGQPRPADESWTCSCGTVNKGKFCMNCGSRKPEKKMRYRCSKCGWEPANPENRRNSARSAEILLERRMLCKQEVQIWRKCRNLSVRAVAVP